MAVGKQIHHLNREKGKQNRQHERNAGAQQRGDTKRAADAAGIAFSPVLADQNSQTALHAKNNAD